MNPLDILLLVPLSGFLLMLLLPKSGTGPIRVFALIVSITAFLLSIGIAMGYKTGVPGQQFVTDVVWVQNPNIHYHVGLDGLSLWLVVLSTFLTPIGVLLSWQSVYKNVKEYFALLLLLEFALIGVFSALDLIIYYGFWELTLVPMTLFIGAWGSGGRVNAALKFFLYTFAGSVLMLVGIIFLTNRAGTSNYSAVLDAINSGKLALSATEQLWLFLAFFVAFAIKLALFPLHTWLPSSYTAAPSAATLMLAAVMAKMGTYSILRFCLPLFPSAAHRCASVIAVLAIIGIVYGALVALVQPNIKRLVAYSSMSHIGFVVLGIFSFTQMGLDGAVYQMLNHGVTTGCLFVLIGMLSHRRPTLDIADYRGLATAAPWFATAFLIATLASIGLPLLNNFVGEFLILQGAAQAYFPWAVWAALGIILSACYMLWMYSRVFYGESTEKLRDLNLREWVIVTPLIAAMFWMGIYTQTFLPVISATNAQVLEQSRANEPFRVRTDKPAGLTEVARHGR